MIIEKVNYIPYGKNILMTEYVPTDILVPKTKLNIVSVNDVTDKELKELGMNTKGAMQASKGSEEQDLMIVIAVGPKVDKDEVQVGDKLVLKGAAQVYGVKIGDKIYAQAEEFWVAGKMI